MDKSPNQHSRILLTDVGSTTTKGLLVEQGPGGARFSAQVNVPTTVEKPEEDVKIGVGRVFRELEKLSGVPLCDSQGRPTVPYLTTSSAGGGLQMLAVGLSQVDTGRVAELAAQGAGGIVLRTLTLDDGLGAMEQIRLILELHQDMILMAGGYDGGAIWGTVRLAEHLALAAPQQKFWKSAKIPLIFCGNRDARPFVEQVLAEHFELHIIGNIRPKAGEFNLEPAREIIHRLFMDNVMEHAPGYDELKQWVSAPILPTPAGVEQMLKLYAEAHSDNILMVDMGGATTDIFTLIAGDYRRTVSANIGLSYSLCNILVQSGLEAIRRHLPPEHYPFRVVRDYLANKTLNPTRVPRSDSERFLEQAAAVEGLRLAWTHHREMNYQPVQLSRRQRIQHRRKFRHYDEYQPLWTTDERNLFQISQLNLLIGSGGVLSRAEGENEAFWMLAEGFRLPGITRLVLDRGFKSPHLGVLSSLDPTAALKLYTKHCLEDLGYVVAPTGRLDERQAALSVENIRTGESYSLAGGEVRFLPRGGELILRPGKCNYLIGEAEARLNTELPILLDCRTHDGTHLDSPLARRSLGMLHHKPGKMISSHPAGGKRLIEREQLIERRLPYPGETFVRVDQRVEPDTALGVNRYDPPRLYIVDLKRVCAHAHKDTLRENELSRGLLVCVGDEVQADDPLFIYPTRLKHYLDFSRAGVNIQALKAIKRRNKDGALVYPSPVRGLVTHIEPSGLIIMREIQDYDGEPHVVDVARELRIKPHFLAGHLKVRKGDFVVTGQTIALAFPHHRALSPTSGVVTEIDYKRGLVTIQYPLNPHRLHALVGGIVERVEDGSHVWIRHSGTRVSGTVGFGPETWGSQILLDEEELPKTEHRGRVLLSLQPLTREFLERAKSAQVAGVIAPSMHLEDWVNLNGHEVNVGLTGDEEPPFTVVLTEGFGGEMTMNEELAGLFREAAGSTVSLNGRTQLRAGVIRPQIYLMNPV